MYVDDLPECVVISHACVMMMYHCASLYNPPSVPLLCSAAGLLESLPTLCVLVFSPYASLIYTIHSTFSRALSLALTNYLSYQVFTRKYFH